MRLVKIVGWTGSLLRSVSFPPEVLSSGLQNLNCFLGSKDIYAGLILTCYPFSVFVLGWRGLEDIPFAKVLGLFGCRRLPPSLVGAGPPVDKIIGNRGRLILNLYALGLFPA